MDLESKSEVRETMREKLKKGWHRKLVSTGLAISLALVSVGAVTKTSEAYDSKTHKQIASDGILSIANDKGYEVKANFSNEMVTAIMNYSTMPDLDEDSTGHYYDSDTGLNYKGDKYNTALAKFVTHYNNAVSLGKDGHDDYASQELGRAIHYFSDLNQPQHAANIPAVGGSRFISGAHLDYELWLDRYYRINYARTTADKSIYDEVLNKSVEQIGIDAAKNAKAYAYFIRNTYYELDNNNKRSATINTLPRAEQYSAAIMFKYLVDTGKVTVDSEGNIVK